MKNFILKHKTLLFSILLFLLLIIFNNKNVFATDDVVTYTDRFGNTRSIVNCPLDTQYGYIIKGNYMFVLSDADAYFYMTSWGGDSTSLFVSGNCKCLVLSSNNTVIDRIGDQGSGRFAILSEINYTSVDIYKEQSKSGIALTASPNFFQVAPPEEETPEIPEETTQETATLPEIMEQVEKGAVLKEIVALLPVILSVLVSLIALRKALKMLLDFLRAS